MPRQSRSAVKARNAPKSKQEEGGEEEEEIPDAGAIPHANVPIKEASDDEDDADADADGVDEDNDNDNDNDGDDDEEDDDADEDDDRDGNKAESPSHQGASPEAVARTPTPASRSAGGRRRRLGRPPRSRGGSRWTGGIDGVEGNDDRARSETSTPVRRGRGRGRPWGSGFRGRGRGGGAGNGPSHLARIPLDKDGNPMEVANDEIVLPPDPEGETKVDSLGNLQGGREYRVRTFTLPTRDGRLYMLSTEPARCTGFRDSYLFFTKHTHLHKIIINDAEKHDIIKRDIIPHSYKGRAIGVVTARSVFREFGARIVVGGRRITDDYAVRAARERGDVEGELADPYDRLPPPGEPYNRNQYVAWHGASSVYHTNQQANIPTMPGGKLVPGAKRRVNITSANWQVEHARAASRYNSTLATARRAALAGTYDPHCNTMLYPRASQPTHAKWEQLYPPANNATADITTSTAALKNNNNINNVHQNNDYPPSSSSAHPPIPPLLLATHLITDTVFESPPFSGLGLPGPDGDAVDVGTNWLPLMTHLTDGNADDEREAMDVEANVCKAQTSNDDQVMRDDNDEIRASDINSTVPPDCRRALATALAVQAGWRERWHTETTDGARGKLKMGFVGVPV